MFELVGARPRSEMLGDLGLLDGSPLPPSAVALGLKRALDIVLGGLALVLTAPVILAAAAAIRVEDGGRVLYRQRRVGRNDVPFDMFKLRTMREDAEHVAERWRATVADAGGSIDDTVAVLKRQNDPRVTRVGRFLRRTSIDELPQLLNVVRGDMSLVGPRPLREFEVDSLSDWHRVRHDMRPGMTGLWQVLGRSDISWAARIELDCSYVRHWSLPNDVRIVLRTLPVVLRGRGAK
jgi:exopolysaccharide biosynthesis polyprenyl glycosylphosphotransferase